MDESEWKNIIKTEREDLLFTKKDWINILGYCIVLIGSVFAGMTVYLFFIFEYLTRFPDPGFFTMVNIGALILCFYVIFRLYHYFKYVWLEWRNTFHWIFRKDKE